MAVFRSVSLHNINDVFKYLMKFNNLILLWRCSYYVNTVHKLILPPYSFKICFCSGTKIINIFFREKSNFKCKYTFLNINNFKKQCKNSSASKLQLHIGTAMQTATHQKYYWNHKTEKKYLRSFQWASVLYCIV